ncbi:MAG: type II toxin-antitoxin system PemK/MazF family toxin [Candidatus Nanopelagicales bacterium]|nr:type II toxin-antitoxin system PemK/MazF family toxin [Candidatus Nanopelagicales bacterium]
MKRGDIWDVDFPGAGRHPGLILTNDVLLARLGSFTVALVTHTEGPASTHVPIGPAEGCEESFVNLTDIHTVRARHFKRKRGEVDWHKGRHINQSLIRTLDLDQP